MKPAKVSFKVLPGVFILLFVSTNLMNAQDFPLKDFAKVYFTKGKYGIEQYQTDTTMKSKKEFLNRLKVIDPKSYADVSGLMEITGDNFPPSFYITDMDRNGIQEYMISGFFEGVWNLCFTFKNNKMLRFLDDISFEDLLIENPQKIWAISSDFCMDCDLGVLGMPIKIYSVNLTTLKNKYLFSLYKASQFSPSDSSEQRLYLEQPKTYYRSKSMVLSEQTVLYANYSMVNNFRYNSVLNKGSYGWVIADTLNSYFAIFDSTSNVSGSPGYGVTDGREKGYIMCWIPKKVAEFSTESEISGLYEDKTSKEYLRVVQTQNNLYINYFSAKSFERSLLIDSSDPAANKYTVRFKKGGEKYLLESKENYKALECTNPNQKKQKFVRIE